MALVTLPFNIANGQLIDATPVMANYNALATAINTLVTPLAGPNTLTGVWTFLSSPQVPTPAPGDNTTNVASTAFVTTAVNSVSGGSGGFKNKIINGSMTIAQRSGFNGSVTLTTTPANNFSLDRWGGFTSVAPAFPAVVNVGQNLSAPGPSGTPTGYNRWMVIQQGSGAISLAATDVIFVTQKIEQDFIRDLSFGTANATSVTISFWAQSSLTGTFSGVLLNGVPDRSYVFTFTISSANTWQFFSITLAGDVTGTWTQVLNATGMQIRINIGSGANFLGAPGSWQAANYVGATGSVQLCTHAGAFLALTGVRIEKGSTANADEVYPFEYQLALCQRYYEKSFRFDINPAQNIGLLGAVQGTTIRAGSNTQILSMVRYNTAKRSSTPTITFYNPSAANGQIRDAVAVADWSGTSANNTSEFGFVISGLTPGGAGAGDTNGVQWTSDAEL